MPLSRRDLVLLGTEQWVTAGFIEPGDMMMGRVVHATETEVPFVKITLDDGSHVHAHVYDEIDVDSRAQRWCRLEPTFGEDGERSGWRLVLLMDGDWQDWSFQPDGHNQRLTLELRDKDVIELGNAAAATCMAILMQETES